MLALLWPPLTTCAVSEPTSTKKRELPITSEIRAHLQWQQDELQLTNKVNFLVLRPGDRYTICKPAAADDLRSACRRSSATAQTDQGLSTSPWDSVMLERYPGYMRPIPGIGNVFLSLVSAALVAVLSNRVLLIENTTSLVPSFDETFSHLAVETSGWASRLEAAARDDKGVRESFAAHDDSSGFQDLCSANLLKRPSTRVWRIFSNQYFLPLLLLNPHHYEQVELLAERERKPIGSRALAERKSIGNRAITSGAISAPLPAIWRPALRVLLRPAPALLSQIKAWRAQQLRGGGVVVGMHVRSMLKPDTFGAALTCVKSRLRAKNSSTLYLATMHKAMREKFVEELKDVARVVWYEHGVEKQGVSRHAMDSAVIDLWLLGSTQEVLLSKASTFGYVAHALSHGAATIFGPSHVSHVSGLNLGDCSQLPTNEAAFHYLPIALRTQSTCRVGEKRARQRQSQIYTLSAIQHR